MPYIRVVYKGKDLNFDYVPTSRLGALIHGDEISHFYRPSERRWVSIRFDAIRGNGGYYQGPERRIDVQTISQEKDPVNGYSNNMGCDAEWLDFLWQQLED